MMQRYPDEARESDGGSVSSAPTRPQHRLPNYLMRIKPDSRYPGMYRVVQSDGSLSDMANLTRARDAAVARMVTRLARGAPNS
jgi:hypothetical protein